MKYYKITKVLNEVLNIDDDFTEEQMKELRDKYSYSVNNTFDINKIKNETINAILNKDYPTAMSYINQYGYDMCLEPVESKQELIGIINDEIRKNGNKCNLNIYNVSDINDMSDLFKNSNFNGDISLWNTANVTNMESIFEGSEFNGNIKNWDVRKVKNFKNAFKNSEFAGDLSLWQPVEALNMSGMFEGSVFNGRIEKWNVDNVKDMSYMFKDSLFDRNISTWTASHMETAAHMFENAQFNGKLKFLLINTEDLSYMFAGNTEFSCDLSNLDTGNVENMSYMFAGTRMNFELSDWDVRKVTNFEGMFTGACYNQPLENWEPVSAENLSHMFENSLFDQEIDKWGYYLDRYKVKNVAYMFAGKYCKFNQDLHNWKIDKADGLDTMFAENKCMDSYNCPAGTEVDY